MIEKCGNVSVFFVLFINCPFYLSFLFLLFSFLKKESDLVCQHHAHRVDI